MVYGNPSDVGYQPQTISPELISGLINQKAKGAEGINAFNQSNFFPQLNQAIQTIGQRNKQKQQQAAHQQLIQGMGTPQTQGQPPTAGVGGFNQNAPPQTSGYPPFNGMDPVKLLGLLAKSDPQGAQELVEKMIQQKMQGPNVRDQYLQWKMSQQPQTKTGSGQGGWRMIQTRDGSAYLYNESTGETKPIKGPMAPPAPKPVRPNYDPQKLDVKVQEDNAKNASALDPILQMLGLPRKPKIVNPLQQNQTGVPQQGQTFNGKKVVAVEQVQ